VCNGQACFSAHRRPTGGSWLACLLAGWLLGASTLFAADAALGSPGASATYLLRDAADALNGRPAWERQQRLSVVAVQLQLGPIEEQASVGATSGLVSPGGGSTASPISSGCCSTAGPGRNGTRRWPIIGGGSQSGPTR
jgi:hypothetical protein